MDNCRTIDIEDALQALLNAGGIRAFAPPVPHDLEGGILVTRTGGQEQSYVQDVHAVSLDCYAATDAEAVELAGRATRWLRALPGESVGGVPCYAAEVTALPYLNTDPDHPTLPRCTLNAYVTTRVAHERKEG